MNNVTATEWTEMRFVLILPLILFFVIFPMLMILRSRKQGQTGVVAGISRKYQVAVGLACVSASFFFFAVSNRRTVVHDSSSPVVMAIPQPASVRKASVDAWRSAMSLSQDVGQYACRELAFEGVAANIVTDMRAGISRGSQHKLSLEFTIRSYDLAVDREKDAMMAALRRRILKAFPEIAPKDLKIEWIEVGGQSQVEATSQPANNYATLDLSETSTITLHGSYKYRLGQASGGRDFEVNHHNKDWVLNKKYPSSGSFMVVRTDLVRSREEAAGQANELAVQSLASLLSNKARTIRDIQDMNAGARIDSGSYARVADQVARECVLRDGNIRQDDYIQVFDPISMKISGQEQYASAILLNVTDGLIYPYAERVARQVVAAEPSAPASGGGMLREYPLPGSKTMFVKAGVLLVMVCLGYVFLTAKKRGPWVWPLRLGSTVAFILLCLLAARLFMSH